jgi:hypothetical protein
VKVKLYGFCARPVPGVLNVHLDLGITFVVNLGRVDA